MDGILELSVRDIVGKRILDGKRFLGSGSNMINIDVSAIRSGMYVLEIGNSDLRKSMLFIKE
jgi:hypothetical protein